MPNMKKELDGEHPASRYLVVEDPGNPATWELRVKGANDKPDHRLMGAAWAALHGGYRGVKYEGSQKQEAISRLRALYKAEGLAIPENSNEPPFIERRICPITELRIEGRNDPRLIGYASVFDQLSLPLSGFRERVKPGAFSASLSMGPDVRALINHDPNLVLGRTTAKTLDLEEDKRGLRADIKLPNTQFGRDLTETISRGDVNQMSFGFRVPPGGDAWGEEDGETIRELQEVNLIDVSVVTFPAYTQTRVDIRSYIKFLENSETAEEEARALAAGTPAPFSFDEEHQKQWARLTAHLEKAKTKSL